MASRKGPEVAQKPVILIAVQIRQKDQEVV